MVRPKVDIPKVDIPKVDIPKVDIPKVDTRRPAMARLPATGRRKADSRPAPLPLPRRATSAIPER
jgi:hypothetical protein